MTSSLVLLASFCSAWPGADPCAVELLQEGAALGSSLPHPVGLGLVPHVGTPHRTGPHGIKGLIAQAHYDSLRRAVFATPGRAWYAVLDGAQIDGLPERLKSMESACLFSSGLDPMLEAAAPHVLRIEAESPGCRMALQEGWNQHWGIVLETAGDSDLAGIRNHLRSCLRVRGTGGETLLFRFYDPRVFRTVIPALKPIQREDFFGPIIGCWIESREADTATYFSRDDREPRAISLAPA